MVFKINKFFLFIIIILLQSCSGGSVGNFLESSFKNVEEPKIKKGDQYNLKDKIIIKPEENYDKNKKFEEPKIKKGDQNNFKNKIIIKSEEDSKNNKKITQQNSLRQQKKYQPQSYKIIFILKDVDPKYPIENLSTILRNSDINFEIEMIERFFDSKDKSIKKN